MKTWKILSNTKNINLEGIGDILFANRLLKSKKEKEQFLNPKYPKDLTEKDVGIAINNFSKAIKRILKAINDQEQIVVYGDYDCDGITATAILWEQLYEMGAKALPYIPDREEDGYGLSESGLNKLKEQIPDTKLIITVDHGIVAVEQTEYANKKLDFEIIISDHHTKGKKLPKAFAIIHTTKLSGAGIAWFIANKLKILFRKTIDQRSTTNDSLDLAALGTIADMVPLHGPNRSIAKYGLEKIQNTQRIGLLALIQVAGLTKDQIGTYEIGYILAPRLNALGRIDNAIDALRLLCTNNAVRADSLAKKLNEINLKRQKLTEETVLNAKTIILETVTNSRLIFAVHEEFNQGIIGLVAGKLVEEFYRPAIVVSKGEKISKASARSISGFNIVEAIRTTSDLLINVGGHPMAAGFTIETEKLEMLKNKLEILADQQISDEMLFRTLKIDCEIDLAMVDWKLWEMLEKFKPFGMENPEPVFCSEAEVVDFKLVGKTGKHLKLRVKASNNNDIFDAIAFGFGYLTTTLKPGAKIKLAYTIDKNVWNGDQKIQLKVRDVKE